MAASVNNGIPNQCAIFGQAFSYQIPADAFSGTSLTYTAEIHRINPSFNGGQVVPSVFGEWFWLKRLDNPFGLDVSYNWLTLSGDTFSGTPSDVWYHDESIQILVTATDTDQSTAQECFTITMHEFVSGVTPTPMAKTAAECAYVVNSGGQTVLNTETLGLSPGDTIGIEQGATLSFTNISALSGIPGNPIYITNVGGTAVIDSTGANTYWQQGQYYRVIGQGTPSDPYGIDIQGAANPGIQVINSYHDVEIAYCKIHDTGFTSISVKSQYVQRPMLTLSRLVKTAEGQNPASEAEMNAISASEFDFCVRQDLRDANYDEAYTKFLYRNGQWVNNYHTDIEGGSYLGRLTTTQRDASSPSVGDWIYNITTNQFNIFNVCEDWVVWYDMKRVRIHDLFMYRIGSERNTLTGPDYRGEGKGYKGFGQYENDHNEFKSDGITPNDFFPNGPHDIRNYIEHHVIVSDCGFDDTQLKNMPHFDNFIHRTWGQNYGLGTTSEWNIGVQDEGLFLGEGFSGYYAYNFAYNCGPISPNGYQNFSSNNTLYAFNVIHNNDHWGRIPIYGRQEGLLGGTTPANVWNNCFYNTFIHFDGRGDNGPTQYYKIIDWSTRCGISKFRSNLFADMVNVTGISGPTVNTNNIIFNGGFENLSAFNYNPISGNAVGTGDDLSAEEWGPIAFEIGGIKTLFDIYGNTIGDSPNIGAAHGSPIIDQNLPPIANAGADQSISVSVTTLDGTASSDPDGTISTYLWEQVSGPNTANILTPSGSSTIVNGLIVGDYVFRLTVTDNDSLTDTDTVTITVNPATTTTKVNVRVLL